MVCTLLLSKLGYTLNRWLVQLSENRALREKNARLEHELDQLKVFLSSPLHTLSGMQGTGSARSMRSFGSVKSRSSHHANQLLEVLKSKVYSKNAQLRDAFR